MHWSESCWPGAVHYPTRDWVRDSFVKGFHWHTLITVTKANHPSEGAQMFIKCSNISISQTQWLTKVNLNMFRYFKVLSTFKDVEIKLSSTSNMRGLKFIERMRFWIKDQQLEVSFVVQKHTAWVTKTVFIGHLGLNTQIHYKCIHENVGSMQTKYM